MSGAEKRLHPETGSRSLDGSGNPNGKHKKKKKSSAVYVLSTALLILAVLFVLYITISTATKGYTNLFGFSLFRVVTPSMEPTIPVNAILISRAVDIEGIEKGDIICFRSYEPSHYGVIVTHRVVAVLDGGNGNVRLESRGDANQSSDAHYVQKENLIGKVIWYSGGDNMFTNVLSFLSGNIGFLVILVLPALIIAGLVLGSAGKNMKKEIQAMSELKKSGKVRNPEEEPEPDEGLKLAGFDTLTENDFDEIYEKVRAEMRAAEAGKAKAVPEDIPKEGVKTNTSVSADEKNPAGKTDAEHAAATPNESGQACVSNRKNTRSRAMKKAGAKRGRH